MDYTGELDVVIPMYTPTCDAFRSVRGVLEATTAPVNVIVVSKKESCAANIKTGMDMSRAPVLIIMDDDVIVPVGGLRRLASSLLYLHKRHRAGAVGPRIMGPGGLPLGNTTQNLGSAELRKTRTHELSGCCFATLPGLGAEQHLGYRGSQWQDTDFFRQLENLEYTLWFDGGVTVQHMAGRRLNAPEDDYNRNLYHERWPAPSCGCCTS